jgi:hypothetical protein
MHLTIDVLFAENAVEFPIPPGVINVTDLALIATGVVFI